MRFFNSLKNASVAWISQILLILIKFITRTFFIFYLSEEYLGLNGLFSNVLSMLSLAELGVGSAIIYSLYKPISEKNEEDIAAIMNLYKKVYILIGIFILVAGFSLAPFLDFFIKDVPDIPYIQIFYLLYVLNTAISYFFSYKSSFVTANQKNYVVILNRLLFNILMNVCQIILLVITQDFMLYLILQVVFTFLENFTISMIANKQYPILKRRNKVRLKDSIKNEIIKNTGAMVFHKVGSVIVFSSSNLILSKMVGLISVGIYSNYSMIITAVDGVLQQMFNSLVATIGNLRINSSVEKQKDIYNMILFINFILYSFFSVCLLNLLNPFIRIWIGEKYVFPAYIVFILVINFYLTGMRKATSIFKDAYGLFWQNKFMPLYESVINIICSVFLTWKLGIIGVFFGTMISSILTCVWIEPYVLFKYGFKDSIFSFFKKYVVYLLALAILFIVSIISNLFITGSGFLYLVLRLCICIIVQTVVCLLLFYKSREFNLVKKYIQNFLEVRFF